MTFRAEQQTQAYRERMLSLRRADAFSAEAGGAAAGAVAAFSVGYLMGAGLPEAAATVAHLFRRAYPGAYLPAVVEGEA
jgi:hypothetical protein